MSLEDDVVGLLEERKGAVGTFRSGLQFMQLGSHVPPNLVKAIRDLYRKQILCASCEPELVMIADSLVNSGNLKL